MFDDRRLGRVGVGITVAHDPLRGSGRADFPHPALTLGDNAHADVPAPAHWAQQSGSVSGLRFAVAGSLWSNLFPPSPPPPVAQSCSGISQVLQVCPTSRLRSSSTYVFGLLDAPRSLYLRVNTGSPGSLARCFHTCTGSLTARDPVTPRVIGVLGGAFRFSLQRQRPQVSSYAAEYPTHIFPCQRFDATLASGSA